MPNTNDLFELLENAIRNQFILALLRHPVNDAKKCS